MIIDGHVHIRERDDPVWGTAPFTADDMIALMDEPITVLGEAARIDKVVAMPGIGESTVAELSFEEQHAVVIRAVEDHPDRIIGNFVLNPRLGVEAGIETLRKLVATKGFRMVKLHPTIHNYNPQRKEFTYPVLEEAAALGIPVLIHMGEPPYSVPSLLDPVASDHPNTNIIIGHFGTQSISYAYDAINVARHNPNVFLETGTGALPRVREGCQALGPERLVFGSDSPPQDIYRELRTVECLHRKPPLGVGLSEDEVRRILGGNLSELMQLPSS